MDIAKILQAPKAELMRHTWDSFIDEPPSVAHGGKGVAVTGCMVCKKRTKTNQKYLRHLADDVLPHIIDRVLSYTTY